MARFSAVTSTSRRGASSSSSGEKNSSRDCVRLARYIAASARWSSCSALSPWVGPQAIPTVASTLRVAPATSICELSCWSDLLGRGGGVGPVLEAREQHAEAVALHAGNRVAGRGPSG